MKGIILSGGTGSRLFPVTRTVIKQLLPVYDKPMVYYPLSVMMKANIKEILIISTPRDLPAFQELFGDGSHLGLAISYKEQPHPGGLAQAFLLGEDFIQGDDVALILGDNILHGEGLTQRLAQAVKTVEEEKTAVIFGYWVKDAKAYGVIEFDRQGEVLSIEEKPQMPKSNYASVGLYFYNHQVVEMAKQIKPSARGELEITTLNQMYLEQKRLKVQLLGQGFAWLDMGTPSALLEASRFIETLEHRQGLKVGCIEEIAYRKRWIDDQCMLEQARRHANTEYGAYLEAQVTRRDQFQFFEP